MPELHLQHLAVPVLVIGLMVRGTVQSGTAVAVSFRLRCDTLKILSRNYRCFICA
jgi:hypothetical protein